MSTGTLTVRQITHRRVVRPQLSSADRTVRHFSASGGPRGSSCMPRFLSVTFHSRKRNIARDSSLLRPVIFGSGTELCAYGYRPIAIGLPLNQALIWPYLLTLGCSPCPGVQGGHRKQADRSGSGPGIPRVRAGRSSGPGSPAQRERPTSSSLSRSESGYAARLRCRSMIRPAAHAPYSAHSVGSSSSSTPRPGCHVTGPGHWPTARASGVTAVTCQEPAVPDLTTVMYWPSSASSAVPTSATDRPVLAAMSSPSGHPPPSGARSKSAMTTSRTGSSLLPQVEFHGG